MERLRASFPEDKFSRNVPSAQLLDQERVTVEFLENIAEDYYYATRCAVAATFAAGMKCGGYAYLQGKRKYWTRAFWLWEDMAHSKIEKLEAAGEALLSPVKALFSPKKGDKEE